MTAAAMIACYINPDSPSLPFRWVEGLYLKERQDFYATNIIWQAHNDHCEGG